MKELRNEVLCSLAKSLLQYPQSLKSEPPEVIHINEMNEMPLNELEFCVLLLNHTKER